jgi:hypothetical protein
MGVERAGGECREGGGTGAAGLIGLPGQLKRNETETRTFEKCSGCSDDGVGELGTADRGKISLSSGGGRSEEGVKSWLSRCGRDVKRRRRNHTRKRETRAEKRLSSLVIKCEANSLFGFFH